MLLGNAFDFQGNVDSTYHYSKSGYDLQSVVLDNIERNEIVTTFATNLGTYYFNKGELNQAIRYYSEAAESCIRTENKNGEAVIYNYIGNIYGEQNEQDRAIEYYNKSLALRKEIGNEISCLYVYPNLMTSYLEIENYDMLFKDGYIAKKLADSVDIPMFRMLINSNLATGESNYGRPQIRLDLINEIAPLVNEAEMDLTILLEYYEACFLIYMDLKQYSKAEKYFKLKDEITRTAGWKNSELPDMYNKMNLYNQLGIQDSVTVAIDQLAKAIEDRLEDKVSEMGKIEAKYTNLENVNKVKLLEKEKLTISAVSARNRIAALSALAIALLILFFLYRNNRQKKVISLQNKELSTLNKTKDQIFSIIGHDLKKPVLAFRGLHDKFSFLINTEKHDKLLKFSKSIDKDAVQLNKQTGILLSWALLQKDVLTIDMQSVNLREVIEESINLFSAFAKNKSISIIHNIPDVKINSDRHALSTIIRNLIDNAIKYTSEGGTVELSSSQKENTIQDKVKDTGVGIPDEKLAGIFLLSKNKSGDGTHNEKGTGLGLHIVKELVEKCKGIVTIESQLNKGTTFTLSLPV